jgi:hypothetical protein
MNVKGLPMRVLMFLLCAACGNKPTTDCTVTFSGNIDDSVDLPRGCSGLSLVTQTDGSNNWQLAFDVGTARVARVYTTIDFASPPVAGEYSSEGTNDWSVFGEGAASQDCSYNAGAGSMPTGSYKLTLTAVDVAKATGIAHGTLAVQTYVHAPPAEDCGSGDTETVLYEF